MDGSSTQMGEPNKPDSRQNLAQSQAKLAIQIHNEDRSWIGVVMILPQVHLRKPCYDFTFL